ncbi:MAG TPA: hypothetical protein PKK61_02290 [Defluviitaleaceae bacterium]|nr:hypothetical protein [Defluviitaleaceae bacterium]
MKTSETINLSTFGAAGESQMVSILYPTMKWSVIFKTGNLGGNTVLSSQSSGLKGFFIVYYYNVN